MFATPGNDQYYWLFLKLEVLEAFKYPHGQGRFASDNSLWQLGQTEVEFCETPQSARLQKHQESTEGNLKATLDLGTTSLL